MKIYFTIIISFFCLNLFSQASILGETYKQANSYDRNWKIFDITSNYYINNKESIDYTNNLEFILYPSALYAIPRIKHLNYGFGAGIFINNKKLFYLKFNSIYYISRVYNIGIGFAYDFAPSNNNSNTGLFIRKDFTIKKWFHKSINFNIHSGLNYISSYNCYTIGLGAGININKIVHYKKPVVYFYPKDTINLKIDLSFKGDFTFTWPKYNNGWNLKIYPNSKIINLNDNKTYDYLFWEGTYIKPNKDTISSGFIIKKENLSKFLVNKLEYIGLNEREINDFITYWVPLLNKKKYLINFIQNEDCNIIANYTFSKNPDTFIRLIVIFAETNKDRIKKQNLIKNNRNGFTVTEWGGIEI